MSRAESHGLSRKMRETGPFGKDSAGFSRRRMRLSDGGISKKEAQK